MAKNTKSTLIAQKYAEALLQVESNEQVIDDLDLISEAIKDSKDLQELLNNPAIQKNQKKTILEQIFNKQKSSVINTIGLLIDKRRSSLISLVAREYKRLFFKKSGIEIAQIGSVTKLSETELNNIKEKLEKLFNKTINIENQENPDLIAGLKIQVAGKVIDSSLKNKLKNLRQVLEQ
jgi:F-type H+-transporting ATPase subunit delta